MLSRAFDAMLFLLNPRSFIDYVVKLLLLCSLTTAVSIGTEKVIGTEVSNPIQTYFLIVFVISAPFFTLCMLVTRRLVQLQAELAEMVETDMLTGLANRRAFFDRAHGAGSGALLMVDADHFKRINDTHGHEIGDRVLVAVAEHLRGSTRKSDVVARMGGEEFAVLLDDATREIAQRVSERISKGVTYHDDDLDAPLQVTLSVGVTMRDDQGCEKALFRRADAALYDAKRNGRACVRWWTPETPEIGAATASA